MMQKREMRVAVQQNGNHISVSVDDDVISYEVQGIDLPEITNWAFCLWHVLPAAMRRGASIHVSGPVDHATIAAAQRYSETWELWSPYKHRAVKVTAEGEPPRAAPGRRKDLYLFSGGLDSADMLVRHSDSESTGVALTARGFDYAVDDSKFNELAKKVAPFLQKYNFEHVIVKTNAIRYAKVHASYPVRLVGLANLFSGLFEQAAYAADFDWAQDIAVAPWSCNHVTNSYWKTSDMEVRALCDDRTRAEKVSNVAECDVALRSLSFCSNREVHPENCGSCKKCLRMKVMLRAMTGEVPEIFKEMSFNDEMVASIDLRNTLERAFFIDLLQKTRAANLLDQFPAMEKHFSAEFGATPGYRPPSWTGFFPGFLKAFVPSIIKQNIAKVLSAENRPSKFER